jgi:hypothetical protein
MYANAHLLAYNACLWLNLESKIGFIIPSARTEIQMLNGWNLLHETDNKRTQTTFFWGGRARGVMFSDF